MWNDPRPEVFAERVSHAEPAVVPTATPGCQKVLLYEGQWPVHCLPQDTPPDECFDSQRFCYANRTATGAGYLFMVEALRPAFPVVQAAKTWTRATPAVATMRQLVRGLTIGEPEDALVSVRGLWNVAWLQQWSGPGRAVFYVRNTRPDARIGVRVRRNVLARVIDLNRAVEIATYPIEPGHAAPGDRFRSRTPRPTSPSRSNRGEPTRRGVDLKVDRRASRATATRLPGSSRRRRSSGAACRSASR